MDQSINRQIVLEIYRAMLLMGAESDLLGTVGSWGDTLPEEDVLSQLMHWNEETTNQMRSRIEHAKICAGRYCKSLQSNNRSIVINKVTPKEQSNG